MKDLAELIAACTVVDGKGAKVEETRDCMDFNPDENPILGIDCKRTRDELKWQPAKPFKDCIQAMCDWEDPKRSVAERKDMLRDTIEDAMEKLLAVRPRVGVQTPIRPGAIQPANCPYVKREIPCINSVLDEAGVFQK